MLVGHAKNTVGQGYMNQICFQNVEEWSETNITGNNSFEWYFLIWSQVKWADIENYVKFLSKEMPNIKIDDNCLFEVERRLNVHLNPNKLEQLEYQHAEKLESPTYPPVVLWNNHVGLSPQLNIPRKQQTALLCFLSNPTPKLFPSTKVGGSLPSVIWVQIVGHRNRKRRPDTDKGSAHVTTLEEDLKQQPLCQDSPKDVLSNSGLEIKLAIPFVPNRDPPDTPQQSELGEVVH
ncbi:uncharacterized protein TNCV_4350911 [Trichonephila clavipes]|nr:uncharacterized protein TNCV_4350911 [Trichonephila clavipes]